MKAIYLQDSRTIPYTPTVAVNAGDVVVIDGIVAIAKGYIAANTLGAVSTTGVFLTLKAVGAITNGQALYWDAVNQVVTTDPAGGVNVIFGRAVAPALSADASVPVLLNDDRVARQAVIVALTDNSGGAAAATLAAIGGAYSQAGVANAVASLAAQFNALLAACKAAGIVATA